MYIMLAIKSLWFKYILCGNAIDQTQEGEVYVMYGHDENVTLTNRHVSHSGYITVRDVGNKATVKSLV